MHRFVQLKYTVRKRFGESCLTVQSYLDANLSCLLPHPIALAQKSYIQFVYYIMYNYMQTNRPFWQVSLPALSVLSVVCLVGMSANRPGNPLALTTSWLAAYGKNFISAQ